MENESHFVKPSFRRVNVTGGVKNEPRIGLIGTGKMATALAKGWVKSRWTPADCITGTDVLSEAREQFTKATACRTLGSVAASR